MASRSIDILYVEDDDEVREPLGELLREEGYVVDLARTMLEGLELLARNHYRLVLSDYGLPDGTGTQLLHRAKEKGFLDHSSTILITAHPKPEGAEGLRVLRKPIDIEPFLQELANALGPSTQRLAEDAAKQLTSLLTRTPGGAMSHRIELALYVTGSSPASLRALRNLQQVLSGFSVEQVRLSVHDLAKELPDTLQEDRVAFTPTLVKRFPEPRAYLLGTLDSREILLDLLRDAGVDPNMRKAE